MIIRIRSRFVQQPLAAHDDPLFSTVFLAGRIRIFPLLCSLAGHGLGLALFMLLAPQLLVYNRDTVDLSRFHVEPLRLSLTEPIFLPLSSQGAATKPLKPASRTPGSEAAAKIGRATGLQASSTAGAVELPQARRRTTTAPVILQPDFDPRAMPPSTPLPSLAFWARQAPDLPKAPPRRFEVKPGRIEAPSPPARPAELPVLAIPNRETVVKDINIAMAPSPIPERPALPIANSATVPVNARDNPQARTASFESFAGEAANVLAISRRQQDARQVEVPRGFQNAPDQSQSGESGEGAGHAGSVNRNVTPAPDTTRDPGERSGPAAFAGPAAAAQRPGPAQTRPAGAERGAPDSPAKRVADSPKNAADSRAAAPPHTGGAAGVTRIAHPIGGNFDVVIMQSATRDDLPDLGEMLSGAPVYTVYLRVGDRKEWLLEYCVPTRENTQSNPYQVNVEDAGNITPPYPISTSIPSGLLSQQNQKHIVLHGLLTAAGDFRVSKTSDTASPYIAQLLALLDEWRFRPAIRNKKAIDIEVLLVIPPRA